jgi:hypothetical protein
MLIVDSPLKGKWFMMPDVLRSTPNIYENIVDIRYLIPNFFNMDSIFPLLTVMEKTSILEGIYPAFSVQN